MVNIAKYSHKHKQKRTHTQHTHSLHCCEKSELVLDPYQLDEIHFGSMRETHYLYEKCANRFASPRSCSQHNQLNAMLSTNN